MGIEGRKGGWGNWEAAGVPGGGPCENLMSLSQGFMQKILVSTVDLFPQVQFEKIPQPDPP